MKSPLCFSQQVTAKKSCICACQILFRILLNIHFELNSIAFLKSGLEISIDTNLTEFQKYFQINKLLKYPLRQLTLYKMQLSISSLPLPLIYFEIESPQENTISFATEVFIQFLELRIHLRLNRVPQRSTGPTAGFLNTVMVNSDLAFMGKTLDLLCFTVLFSLKRSRQPCCGVQLSCCFLCCVTLVTLLKTDTEEIALRTYNKKAQRVDTISFATN